MLHISKKIEPNVPADEPILDATGDNVPLAGEGAQQTTLAQEETEMTGLVGITDADEEAPISEPTEEDTSL